MTAIGIDLGTTNSVLSILSEKPPHTPVIIKSPFKKNTTPSVVNLNFDSNNNLKTEVGEEAVKLLTKEPENTIFSVKRLMGKKYNKDFHFPYKVEERLNGDSWIKIPKTEIEKKEIAEKTEIEKKEKSAKTEIEKKELRKKKKNQLKRKLRKKKK